MIGKITKKSSKTFTIQDSNLVLYEALIRGKIKQDIRILVGDDVEFFLIDNQYVIEEILPRKNFLIRPSIANIDILILIMPVKEPGFSIKELNLYLAYYESQYINKIFIFLSKTDLLNDLEIDELKTMIKEYEKDKYIFFSYNKKDFKKYLDLFLEKKVICLAGQSGSGKSTLINKTIPNSNITTQAISTALNRGKHTTTTISLNYFKNSYVVDTPGFSKIELNMKKLEYANAFSLYRDLGLKCGFSNCLHVNEKNCNVLQHYNQNKICKLKYLDYLETIKKLPN